MATVRVTLTDVPSDKPGIGTISIELESEPAAPTDGTETLAQGLGIGIVETLLAGGNLLDLTINGKDVTKDFEEFRDEERK